MPEVSQFSSFLDLARSQLQLTLLVVALVVAFFTITVLRRRESVARVVDVLFRSYLFWTITLLFAHQAAVAGAFGERAQTAINAPVIPLQPDAAYAALAFAVIAICALIRSRGLRFAAVVGPAVYMLAPLAVAEFSMDLVMAYVPQLAVVGFGVLLLVLQMGTGRVVMPHRAREMIEA
jgi:hypothetical protein